MVERAYIALQPQGWRGDSAEDDNGGDAGAAVDGRAAAERPVLALGDDKAATAATALGVDGGGAAGTLLSLGNGISESGTPRQSRSAHKTLEL
jgi:hypothetical protein